ncbi:hypothetical protein Acr_25g0001390 [Actinidia rufa]|uniref:Uncharacterized protein n=1 Tax=Actinidia rufa TaxID=165716 RepID=A0A7J0GY26_9ERIC|nr:hypothetical protein Acr_25g0001390 [Actinidia rufa]
MICAKCKGINYMMTQSDLTRAGTSAELSLWGEIGGGLRRKLGADTSRTNATRAKAFVTPEIPLSSKLRTTTALEARGRGNGRRQSRGISGDKDASKHVSSNSLSSDGTVNASCHVLSQDTKGNTVILIEKGHRWLTRQRVKSTYVAVELLWVYILDFLSSHPYINNPTTGAGDPHAPKTPSTEGINYWKTLKGGPGPLPGRTQVGCSLEKKIMERLQRQLAELMQIMVDSRLMNPSKAIEPGQTESRNKEHTLPPREGRDRKQHKMHVSLDSRTDCKIVATSKQRKTPERTKSRVDLRDALNAKWNPEGDLRAKLNGHKAAIVSRVVPICSVAHTTRSEQREAALRYQTSILSRNRGAGPTREIHTTKRNAPRSWRASYKLGMTPKERLWENLTFNPPIYLQDLMSQVNTFTGWWRMSSRLKRPREHLLGMRDRSRSRRRIQYATESGQGTRQGIEANPEQTTAINNLVSPRTAKEVQKLTGMAAALNKFIRAKMAKYLMVAKNLLTKFRVVKIEQVGRDFNSHVDALAGLASVFESEAGRTIAIDTILAPSLETPQELVLVNTELGSSWMNPILNFIRHDQLLEDKREAHKIRAINKTIMNGIKKRLEKAKGNHNPARGLAAYNRTEAYYANHNEEVLAQDLDLMDERKENVLIRMADYQKQLTKTYNQKVQHREFSVSDLVLRKVVGNTKNPADGKLGPNWEGLSKIVKLAGKGRFKI